MCVPCPQVTPQCYNVCGGFKLKVLILGNGVAGISVAKELRSQASVHAQLARGGDVCRELEISVLARESYILKDGLLVGTIVVGPKERARAAKMQMGSPVSKTNLEPKD